MEKDPYRNPSLTREFSLRRELAKYLGMSLHKLDPKLLRLPLRREELGIEPSVGVGQGASALGNSDFRAAAEEFTDMLPFLEAPPLSDTLRSFAQERKPVLRRDIAELMEDTTPAELVPEVLANAYKRYLLYDELPPFSRAFKDGGRKESEALFAWIVKTEEFCGIPPWFYSNGLFLPTFRAGLEAVREDGAINHVVSLGAMATSSIEEFRQIVGDPGIRCSVVDKQGVFTPDIAPEIARFYHADVSKKLPFDDNSIDVMMGTNFMASMSTPEDVSAHYPVNKKTVMSFLAEAARVLREGGRLLLVEPTYLLDHLMRVKAAHAGLITDVDFWPVDQFNSRTAMHYDLQGGTLDEWEREQYVKMNPHLRLFSARKPKKLKNYAL
ncbi:MAG: hypothetical protein AAB553_05020 [Patescibacteria group bacterium]